jgi:hypothetical protein
VRSASEQEHRAYPHVLERVCQATGAVPAAVVADRGYSIKEVFEHNTRRGIASVMPWRATQAHMRKAAEHKRDVRSYEDCDTHDRHGVVRCKHCGGATKFVAFTTGAGGDRGPRLEVQCTAKNFDECRKRQTIACEHNWRMLLPLWRTSPIYLALRHSHDRYERVHHHWRVRYRVASDDHALRPKRRGLDCQQLRANAALLIEWLIVCWREGWLPDQKAPPLEPDRVVIEDARDKADALLDFRRDAGLTSPYGTVAAAKKLGALRPVPARRSDKPIKATDPSEPEEKAVIPASMTKEEMAATEYGRAVAAAPPAAPDPDVPEGSDSSVDVGAPFADHRDDRLPPENLLD